MLYNIIPMNINYANNKQAIKVYEKIGFQFVEKYMQKTNGGEFGFIKMKKII
ncbi:hypothetical protein HMPREF1982_02163 [Clostridiales bacterium oral taxon 876 str. F0540]|nr:hypothetical protein HMPREF1982_02163 [Clostridiales bacterium oral taxon 876 str. F0540]